MENERYNHPKILQVQSGDGDGDGIDSAHSSVAYDTSHKSKRRKAIRGRICSEAQALAMERGKKLQENLTREHPSFIKQMLFSHVAYKFELGAPAEFCRLHLPVHKVEVIFEDESGERYRVKYIPGIRRRFGWKRFAVAHELVESDVVVFHLVGPCYFKVYIIKADYPTVVDSTNLAVNEQTGEEVNLPGSSCLVILKPPSLHSHISTFSKRLPSHSKKKKYKQVAYDGYQTSGCCTIKRDIPNSETHALALKRAKELQTNLPSENPSFIKQIKPSNFRRFELVLSAEFCRMHLPKHEAEVTLEAENGERYEVKFHPNERYTFYAGWRRFSIAQQLLEGDVLVLHLLRPCYFKVFIIRRLNDPNGVGSANLRSYNHLHTNEGGKKKRKSSQVADENVLPLNMILPCGTTLWKDSRHWVLA